jgi:hypothetical protein
MEREARAAWIWLVAKRFTMAFSSILDNPTVINLIVVTTLVAFLISFIYVFSNNSLQNLPPGPRGLPLIGDVQHITNQDWIGSPERKHEYGEFLSFRSDLCWNSQKVK